MTAANDDKNEFHKLTGVSRETLDRLSVYANLIVRWQATVNLIGPSTLDRIWHRHFLDSAQLARYIEVGSSIVDIGSGAGFPGLVLAIMGVGPVDLIERDSRKCVFLTEAARLTSAPVKIHQMDAHLVRLESVSVVTARAFAPLDKLLYVAQPYLGPTSYCVFLKGKTYEEELTAARKNWNMEIEAIASTTDPSGIVLRLRNIVYNKLNRRRI